jgi:hydroxymethylpyrimidine pyrophosphatase-like HAD family hydrolase
MILKDPDGTIDPSSPQSEQGHDYVVVSPRGRSGVSPITLWWFEEHDVKHRIVESLDDDEHPEHTVRVGVCGSRRLTTAVADAIRSTFAGLAAMHHFGAVTPGHEQAAKDAGMTGDEDILIFEAFHPDTDKWTAISWLAKQRDIDPRRICAIGNDVNDLGMLRAAGLGVAMANAIPAARDIATRHTLANDADGVAHAIERVLTGEW